MQREKSLICICTAMLYVCPGCTFSTGGHRETGKCLEVKYPCYYKEFVKNI